MENEQLRTGYVYVIRNDLDNDEYYGSTFQQLSKRWGGHKVKAKKIPDRKLYQKMNEIGFDKFRIILVEEVQVKDKLELRRAEDKYIKELKPALNCRGAIINLEKQKATNKKYKEINGVKIHNQQIKYHEQNKEKENTRCRDYYRKNKDKRKQQSAIYYNQNKEHLLNHAKEYREKNKEKNKLKVDCDCGSTYRHHNKARHNRSIKHQDYLKTVAN